MSSEIDSELKDLLINVLKANGTLSRIKAQLRASVFAALDCEESIKQNPMQNEKVKTFLQTATGQLLFNVIREFLEYFNLNLTLSVYDKESYLGTFYEYEDRNSLVEKLGLSSDNSVPLLLQIFDVAQKFNTSFVSVEDDPKIDKNNEKCSESNASDIIEEISNTSKSSYENVNISVENIANKTFSLNKKNSPNGLGSTCQSTYESEENFTNINMDETPVTPVMKDSKSEKSKLTSSRIKNNFNSSEFPPLSKNRSPILPSMYSKELKEKLNRSEQDQFVETENSYEESFSSEIELDLSYSQSETKNDI